MKYINNGVSQNIIKDSDINLSESFQNQNLAEVLTQYKEELNTLKSNVKWLAKYGGVGGNGGSGESDLSNIKLKYKVDISYANNQGITSLATFASKTSANRILALRGTKATLTVTLLRCLPNTEYVVLILYGTLKHTRYVNSLTLSISLDILCEGNQSLSIIVYATPTDMPETKIEIYTIAKTASLDLKTNDGLFISDGSIILYQNVQNDNTKLIGTLSNYLPDLYDGTITKLTINGIEIPFELTTRTDVGKKESIFEIIVNKVFETFGIYEVIMYINYNGLEEIIKKTFIYKDYSVFLYCYGENNTIYSKEISNPKTSNFSLETVNFRIYPEENASSTQKYKVKYKIEFEDKPDNTIEYEDLWESNKNWNLKFSNIYSKNDFINNDIKKITLTFTIDRISFVYYLYVTQLDEITYIFKIKDGNEDGSLFYNAEHSCTANANEDTDPNTTFPFVNGLFKLLLSDEEHKITRISSKTSMLKATSIYGTLDANNELIGGYVTNYEPTLSAIEADVLISFGLKFYEYNLDKPIVTIQIDKEHVIILYSNKIVYGSNGNSTYTRWFIPDDDKYHLIQLYYKPRYTINGSVCTEAAPNGTSAFIWCIDGVFETQPIYIDTTEESVLFIKDVSSIIYHPGNWDFNFIGVATFNSKLLPSIWSDSAKKPETTINSQVLKYVLDFDPIITANYYQAYYYFSHKLNLQNAFDSSIYTSLYYTANVNPVDSYNVNFYKGCNKFIASDIITLGKLTDLPIYIISPTANDSAEVALFKINDFLYKTFAGGYTESSDPPITTCSFKKGIINGDKILEESVFNDDKYIFEITYQGSSTLMYGVKNFEIKAQNFTDADTKQYPIVWTPDKDVFLPEQSFTLKADVVDSSHSNNVIVGKFVNDYMKDSAFNENCKTCLEGFPILLFMKDTLEGKEGTENIIFLGIYSFNLGRNSVYNLGYKTLKRENCVNISNEDGNSEALILKTGAIEYNNKYRVAEVQGNSPVLFDYSLYDSLLLLNKMLGDYHNYDSSGENTSYVDDFLKPFIGLNKLIHLYLIKSLTDNYTPYEFNEDNSLLCGYYTPKNNVGVFNVLQLNFNYSGKKPTLDSYYYKSGTSILKVPENALLLNSAQIEGVKPYLTKGDNDLTIIGNPYYLFHIVCTDLGVAHGDNLYYIEQITTIGSFEPQTNDYFDYDTLLRYYIVCMLFAMVDSVQKNLTIRCKNFISNSSNVWLVGFYDMDTSFGVDNVGNPVDYKAFSDYISNEGKIITDYFEENSEKSEGAGFDVPSSFLFLAAKYLNIVTPAEIKVAIGERDFITPDNSTKLKTPFNYWQALRTEGLPLYNIDTFFKDYVDNHFASVNPLIWNLNYMYKYFSESGVQSGTDTEQSKFNGTRRFSRKSWLKQRLEIIDVLFGIRNNHTIGNSTASYICKQRETDSVQIQQDFNGFLNSVPIAETMFPLFTKGITGVKIDAQVTTNPRSPIVLQRNISDYTLYIANNEGIINNISADISSNVAVGFYGTKNLKTVNECGLFLWDTNQNNQNTITNNVITDIIINRGPNNGQLKIALNTSSIPSALSIRINAEGTTNKKFKCYLFSLSTVTNFSLKEVIIRYTDVLDVISLTGSGAYLIIENLIIENCSCNTLKLEGILVQNLTLRNNSINEYKLDGKFPTLNITDGNTKVFTLNALEKVNTTINMPALEELSLEGKLESFTNSSIVRSCSKLTLKTIDTETVSLALKGLTIYANDINIPLSENVKNLSLNFSSNYKCPKYFIEGGNLENVTFFEGAFSENHTLTEINLKKLDGTVEALIKNIPVTLTGNSIFYGCHNLTPTYCIPYNNNPFKLSSTSHSSLYYGNPNITLDHVILFLKNTIKELKTINLSYSFSNCSNINFLAIDTNGVVTLPNSQLITDLKAALTNFKVGTAVNFENIFAKTSFNFLDKELIALFLYENTLKEICPASSANNNRYIYIIEDCIKDNDSLEIISIGARFNLEGIVLGETLLKVITLDEDGNYILQNKVDLYNLFNNGKLHTIQSIHFFTSDEVQIDCEQGLPNTITTIKAFNSISNKFNFNKFENLFNNSEDCVLYMDLFFGGDKVNVDNKINIFNLFWKLEKISEEESIVVPKVKLYLHEKSLLTGDSKTTVITKRGAVAVDYSLNFDKICTAAQFKLIMLYLVDLLKSYLDTGNIPDYEIYNQIPGLFLNCEITNISNIDGFKKLITADDGRSYFSVRVKQDADNTIQREINFIDLERTFSNCVLKTGVGNNVFLNADLLWDDFKINTDDGELLYKTKVLNLKRTFYNTSQTKILKPFNIRWTRSLSECFYNCKFENSEGDVILAQPSSADFIYSWAWKDKYALLPAGFFNGFEKCDVTKCFANDSKSGYNIQGQLPQTKDQLWWDDSDIDISTTEDLFLHALIHPMKKVEISEEDNYERTNYYIYPKVYTNAFKTSKNAYKHIIMPYDSENNLSCLYLFEDAETELNFSTLLPCLPDNKDSLYYENFLSGKPWKVRINTKDTFINNSSIMANTSYKNILPFSLFLVLNSLNFKHYNMLNSKPILHNDGNNYNIGIFSSTYTTPGGITINELNDTIENVLL